MRIATQQQYLRAIDQMQRNQAELAKLSDQASGKKLLKPSDDPVAAAQVVKLEREMAQYKKYDDNINVTQRRLELEDSILGSVYTTTDRLRELTLQAGSIGLNDQDRLGIAKELNQLTEYLAGLMNTQDSEGEYLFAGSQGKTQPYIAQADGRYGYQGDDGQRLIQVGAELYVPSNDSGQYLFESVPGRLDMQLTGNAIASGDVFATIPPAGASYTSDFLDPASEQRFKTAVQGQGDLLLTVNEPTPGNYTYEITGSGGAVLAPATAFTPGDTIDFNGLRFDLAAPANMAENTIRLTPGNENKNLLNVAVDLAQVLSKPITDAASRQALQKANSEAQAQFKQAADRTLEARATLGSRLKTLESVSEANTDFKLFTKTALSNLEDSDLVDVASRFKLAKVGLEAAQATFAQISSLSLFNYIR